MRPTSLVLPVSLLLVHAGAWAKAEHRRRSSPFTARPFTIPTAFSTTIPPETVESTKSELLNLAKSLNAKSPTGIFITNPEDRSNLKKAVAELEAVSGRDPTDADRVAMLGDWTLVCTSTYASGRSAPENAGRREVKLPFGLKPPNFDQTDKKKGASLFFIQEAVKRSFAVTQRIRSMGDSESNVIDRVDHVIEFTPRANTLDELFGDWIPKTLQGVKINPFEVSTSKVTLIHNAEVLSVSPVLRTRIGLKSIVLTVAGTSQYLDPDGADLLGLNVPLGDFLNSGNFDTTYVDDDLRISRGKAGPLNQLRVFVRKGGQYDDLSDPADEEASWVPSDGTTPTDVRTAVEDVRDKVEDAVEKVRETVEDAVGSVSEKVEDVVKDVGEVVEAVESGIGNVRGAVEEEVGEVAGAVQSAVRGETTKSEEAVVVKEDEDDDVVEDSGTQGDLDALSEDKKPEDDEENEDENNGEEYDI